MTRHVPSTGANRHPSTIDKCVIYNRTTHDVFQVYASSRIETARFNVSAKMLEDTTNIEIALTLPYSKVLK